jgi:hypothetical protein
LMTTGKGSVRRQFDFGLCALTRQNEGSEQ